MNLSSVALLRKSLLAISALAVIVAVFYSVEFAKKWDNPPPSEREMQGPRVEGTTVIYLGLPIDVDISCDCPRVLTESISRSIPIEVKLIAPWAGNSPDAIDRLPDRLKTKLGQIPAGREIYLSVEAGGAVLVPEKFTIAPELTLLNSGRVNQSFVLKITPTDTTLSQINFHFLLTGGESLGSVRLRVTTRPRFVTLIAPFVYAVLILGLVASTFFWTRRRLRLLRERTEHKLAEAAGRAEANPERVRFAWEVARVKLEAYFDRNLIQVNLVFWVAVFVMAVGFGFVLAGVVLSFHQPTLTPTSLVAAISGIITQFIGATFMVIYRSTMAQANEFMVVLDRINSVGMAVQVLDSIPESEGELKNATRAQIVELLIASSSPPAQPRPRHETTSKQLAAA